MAFNAIFYNLAKRKNSTLQPAGSGTTFSVVLKENTSVMEPTLKLHGASANYNPSSLNYCYIQEFSRYYFVTDWRYVPGFWECDLETDVMATYKTEIGQQVKYVSRASYTYNAQIVDDFYPAKGSETEYQQTYDFGFDIDNGDYVIGIVNRDEKLIGGSTSFYRMPELQLNRLLRYMYPIAGESFKSITSITGDVVRSIINPWDWIVSCKKYPIDIPCESDPSDWRELEFGQWKGWEIGETPVYGQRVLESDDWGILSHDFNLPSDWLTKDAKYRSSQNVKMFLTCNPWGIMQLSPSDFISSAVVRIKIKPDFVTGESLLQVYSVKGPLETLIAQKTANIAVETKLGASKSNEYGALGSVVQMGGGISFLSSHPVMGAFNIAAGIANAAMNFAPTMSNSIGRQEGFRGLDGQCILDVRSLSFVDEDNDEFGKPVCSTLTLNTIPGFIKCGDGEHSIPCYGNEKEIISDYMTNGFFYE